VAGEVDRTNSGGVEERMRASSAISHFNSWRSQMKSMKQLFVGLTKDESGQDLIEYALVAALIALGSVAAMNTLATNISTALNSVGTQLTTTV
jgi:pilus assembly protein Flp/PilA